MTEKTLGQSDHPQIRRYILYRTKFTRPNCAYTVHPSFFSSLLSHVNPTSAILTFLPTAFNSQSIDAVTSHEKFYCDFIVQHVHNYTMSFFLFFYYYYYYYYLFYKKLLQYKMKYYNLFNFLMILFNIELISLILLKKIEVLKYLKFCLYIYKKNRKLI